VRSLPTNANLIISVLVPQSVLKEKDLVQVQVQDEEEDKG
jgi:hypothetical protein